MIINIVAGARPNFMKIAPLIHAIKKIQDNGITMEYRLVHTGQHYDKDMSETFFKDLKIPAPDNNLGCGGGTQAEQTAAIMIAFEKELQEHPADLVMVVGDVTSTMACSIVAKKMQTKVAHVEAGIRSGDMSMPEEINRIVTDGLTDYYFTTTAWAGTNLKKIGVDERQIFFVGNVMIDTLLANQSRLRKPAIWGELNLQPQQYLVMTMHRPSNVDEGKKLISFLEAIDQNVRGLPVIFPTHHRTRKVLGNINYTIENITFVDPMGYLEFNYLVKHAKGVLTDSGGITEETTVMGVPCMTLRDNTERPETVDQGTNVLIGTDPAAIPLALNKLFNGLWKKGSIPEKWDGKASERIVNELIQLTK